MKNTRRSGLGVFLLLVILLTAVCVQAFALESAQNAGCQHNYAKEPLVCGTCGHARAVMSLDTVSLRPSVAGLYFGGTLTWDEDDPDILSCGIVVSLENSKPVADGSDNSCLYSTGNTSVLVTGVFKEGNTDAQNAQNAKKPVYARAYVQLSDGRYAYSDAVGVTLQHLAYTIDDRWESLSYNQKTSLRNMCMNYKSAVAAWEVPNMKNYSPAKETLDGKKVIFFGNSHTYYSRCVTDKGQTTTHSKRTGDQGIFYQLCKANGIDVDITNYAFGVHQLSDFYSGSCAAGKHDGHDHMADIPDFNYDYVIIQQGTKDDNNDLVGDVQKLAAPFQKANPNVKIIFLVHQLAYTRGYAWIEKVALLRNIGVTVVDWGGMLHGIVQGTQTVPGTAQTFDLNSFVIQQSSSDGYHPNLLAGYVTALMTYCAITGETAEGQPWQFAESDILSYTAIDSYRTKYYKYDNNTNFDTVLQTESEMVGIQKLIDQYMAK